MKPKYSRVITAGCAFAPILALSAIAQAATVANPLCPTETAIYAPGHAQDIVVPSGFQVSVFAQGLNAPTGIAFLGNSSSFQVLVLESGHGLPSICNDETMWPGGVFDIKNPFTPDILVFNKYGKQILGPLGKPTPSGGGFQPSGPAIDIAFVNGAFRRAVVRELFQPIDPYSQWAKQQFAHQYREPDDRGGHPVYHQPADR